MKKLDLILLVDDDPIVNFYNEDLLKGMDIAETIEIVKDGQEALDFILKQGDYLSASHGSPNLIFLDINMPRMNGFEFLEKCKEFDIIDKIETIVCMVTTSLHDDDQKKAEEYKEISAYVSKPLDEEKVHNILETLF